MHTISNLCLKFTIDDDDKRYFQPLSLLDASMIKICLNLDKRNDISRLEIPSTIQCKLFNVYSYFCIDTYKKCFIDLYCFDNVEFVAGKPMSISDYIAIMYCYPDKTSLLLHHFKSIKITIKMYYFRKINILFNNNNNNGRDILFTNTNSHYNFCVKCCNLLTPPKGIIWNCYYTCMYTNNIDLLSSIIYDKLFWCFNCIKCPLFSVEHIFFT